MDDIIINKAATIERCLKRINEEYHGAETELSSNYTKQDAIILNIQRACEAAIDMATHVVKIRNLGVPQTSKEVFIFLEKAHIIPKPLSEQLQAMVGFRNVAVHDYTTLNLDIVQHIIEHDLDIFLQFNRYLLTLN